MTTETSPSAPPYREGDARRLAPAVRRTLLVGPALALAVLEVFHPQPDVTPRALMDVSTWFAGFHVVQLVLTGLLAVSVMLLAADLGRAGSWTIRVGVGVFLVFFSAYEAIAGIGTGLAMRSARALTVEQQQGVFTVVKDWPGVAAPFALSIVGTLGWVVAIGALAVAARRQRAPLAVWTGLALAAVLLLAGHPYPGGTLAFGCFAVAAIVHEWRPRSAGRSR